MHTTTSTTTLSSPPPHYALLPSAAHRDVAGEIFVITADRGFHRLESSTAVAVFQMLAGAPHTIEEMATAITATHEVDLDRATVDIGEFVATLVARHIVQAVPPATFTVANL